MILESSRSKAWISELKEKYPSTNPILIEKTIRAFCLLEALVVSGCPFVFKGGTALMLHMKSSRRLSIDIDIICKPGTDVLSYLKKGFDKYGFMSVEPIDRIARNGVPKTHAKCYYEISYCSTPAVRQNDTILLDVLLEEHMYTRIERLPIEGAFLQTGGEPVYVNVPSLMDILGDKMTAFAPNTTGIPYYKQGRRCSMEIIKQLYDVASIFDFTTDLSTVAKAFKSIAPLEMSYRGLPANDLDSVYDDIINVSRVICTWGYDDGYQYGELADGVSRVRDFIFSERFNYDSAVTAASKAAYLAALLKNGKSYVIHYDQNAGLSDKKLLPTIDKRLARLRKSNIEAFFYWQETSKLL